MELDTSARMAARYDQLLGELSGARRLEIAAQLSQGVRALAEAGLRHRHPGAATAEIRCRLTALLHGRAMPERLFGPLPDDVVEDEAARHAEGGAMDVVDVALLMTGALERCGVGYFLGGSLASSFQGEPRATNDIDLVVDLAPSDVEPLAAALGPEFDVDKPALRRAALDRGSWNVFYLPAVTKIDLFILRDLPYDRSEFARRQRVEVRPGQALFVKSPEDSVLRKLLWFSQGGGVSDRQWRDVVQVLRQSRAVIDGDYLDEWAASLGLGDFLRSARDEATGSRRR